MSIIWMLLLSGLTLCCNIIQFAHESKRESVSRFILKRWFLNEFSLIASGDVEYPKKYQWL